MLYVLSNRAALEASRSRVLIPRNCTPLSLSAAATAARFGASARQGAHHEPQMLMTTTLPLYAARLSWPPATVLPDSAGAALRSAGFSTLMSPLPLTKLELPEFELPED